MSSGAVSAARRRSRVTARAARMVARLAGPLPVRLGEVSSLEVTSRTWWCASIDQCSRARRARSCALASALVRLVTA